MPQGNGRARQAAGPGNENVRRPRAIILDIEGTTTPIAFVTKTLFPYARRHLRSFLDHDGDASSDVIARLHAEHHHETDTSCPPWPDDSPAAGRAAAIPYVQWLMDRDRKSPALKDLQGRIWENGYRSGELVGDVFADVASALERWQREGIGAGIFSSGSVLAQKLLFAHSSAGDLTRYLRWYFDTGIGAKGDPESYARIALHIATPPADVLFVSDVLRELDAARTAGMQTAMSMRPGNAPQPAHDHRVVGSFDELT